MQQQRVDTTKKLFDYLYRVSMPYQLTRHEEDIRKFGTRITGVKAIDSDINNQWFVTMISVAEMTKYFEEGVPIKISYEKDIKEIYESISEHIHAWKVQLEHGINIGDAPIKDLVMLDQFANSIYEHAKYQFTPETVDSLVANHILSLQRVNATNFFTNKSFLKKPTEVGEDGITRINAQEEEEIPNRDSLAEFFKTRLITLNNRR